MTTDLDQSARAKEWLAASQNRWRLQTLQMRGRYNPKTGEYKKLPDRLRRFLNGTPTGMVGEALRQLVAAAPYKAPVYNWEYDDGLLYRPTTTAIIKDGVQNAGNTKDATYTIVQDLRLVLDDDWMGFGESASCSELTFADYKWDMADVEDVPDAEQGVSWQIVNVSRDSETDLFSYTLRKSVAITQHMPEETVQCTDRGRVTLETWNNVYGESGDWRWDREVNGYAKLDIPAPCEQEDGVSVAIEWNENPDCTFRVQIRRTYAKAVDGAERSIQRDQYRIQETARDLNALEPLPKEGVEYAGGVVTRYSVKANEDGTFDNTVEKDTERPVESSTIERRVGPRGTRTVRTDTNVASPASSVPAGKYGSYKSTKTPGGLFTNEYSSFVRDVLDRLGLACSDTAFLHSHETSAGADAMPADAHVAAAAGGVYRETSYSMDDEGAVTRTDRVRTEHNVPLARTSVSVTPRGTLTTTVERSAPSRPADPTSIGVTVAAEMTDGAAFNVTKEVFKSSNGVALGVSCEDTLFVHTHETSESADSVPASPEAEAASGGVVRRVSYSVDDRGAVTRTETKRAEHTVENAVVRRRRTKHGVVTETTTRSTDSAPELGPNVGSGVSAERTDGDLLNVTVTEGAPEPGGPTDSSCERTVFEHRDETTETGGAVGDHAESAGGGSYHRLDVTTDEATGAPVTRRTDVKEVPVPQASVEIARTARAVRTTTVNRNMPSMPGAPAGVGGTTRGDMNPGGSVNQTIVVSEPNPADNGHQCERTELRHTHTDTRAAAAAPGPEAPASGVNVDRALVSRQGDDGIWDVQETVTVHNPKTGDIGATRKTALRTETSKVFRNQPAPPAIGSESGSMRASLNDHGSYDGEVTEAVIRPDEKSYTAVDNALVTKRTTHFTNGDAPRDAGPNSDASASEDQEAKWNGTTSTETPHPLQTQVGPYTSEETSPYGRGTITITRTWRAIIFNNQPSVPALAPSGAGQASYSVSATHNKFGLLDGKIECTEVKKVWNDGSGGGSGEPRNIRRTYTTEETQSSFIGKDPDTEKPVFIEETVRLTHEIGLNCEDIPEDAIQLTGVSLTKSKLFNYHAVTGRQVTASAIKTHDQ